MKEKYSKLTVLLIDDIKSMRTLIKGILFKIGFQQVIDAESGYDALNILRKEKVDLIISDWNMPKMDGIELLKAIRADDNLKNTPFLMVTAENSKDRVIEAIQAGTTEFIAKPFTEGTLMEKLAKMI